MRATHKQRMTQIFVVCNIFYFKSRKFRNSANQLKCYKQQIFASSFYCVIHRPDKHIFGFFSRFSQLWIFGQTKKINAFSLLWKQQYWWMKITWITIKEQMKSTESRKAKSFYFLKTDTFSNQVVTLAAIYLCNVLAFIWKEKIFSKNSNKTIVTV